MSRVVPSQVVEFIDQVFPQAKEEPNRNKLFLIGRGHSQTVAAITDLVEKIPPELLALSNERYIELISSISAIKTALEQWKSRDFSVKKIPGFSDYNPVSLLRRTLSECPDEYPSKETATLTFIKEKEFRKNLELDISAVNNALSNCEWKATTVLAGSVVEALLLWALNQKEKKDIDKAIKELVDEKIYKQKPDKNIENWHLFHYVEVAAKMEIINSETAQQARLAKNFRNFIHPGREARFKQKCGRGTALSSVAAVELVVRDLSVNTKA